LNGGVGGAGGKGGTGQTGSATGTTGHKGNDGVAIGGTGIGGNGGAGGGEEDDGTGGSGGAIAGSGAGQGGGGGGGELFSGGNSGGGGGTGGAGLVSIEWTAINSDATNFLRTGYVWIKTADVVTGYEYGCTVHIQNEKDGDITEHVVPNIAKTTSSIEAARLLAEAITAKFVLDGIDGSASNGLGLDSGASIIQVRLTAPDIGAEYPRIARIEARDSFGDLASFGWGHQVDFLSDLPINMGDFLPIVNIGENKKASYWMNFTDGKWKEYRDPRTYTSINKYTMPYTITKKYHPHDETLTEQLPPFFEVRPHDWDLRQIGDDLTNKRPTFVNEPDIDVPYEERIFNNKIKDIFFFRNRLSMVSRNSIVTSEIGEYGNFFKTSVAASLDSDRIDATVESTTAVNIEYGVVLEDSVMIFADKSQFRFKGGDILSPNSYNIQQEMAYDVNHNVRPLFMNDRIYFVARRGSYSAVYEMFISDSSGRSSQANDISVHCQSYIDSEIEKMTGSTVNNMLFLTSRKGFTYNENGIRSDRNTVFVYKFHDNGNTREQSAWSKWTFNGTLLSSFAISKNLYLLIKRRNAITASDWIMGSGQWDMTKQWKNLPWVMSPSDLETFDQFEKLPIYPKYEGGFFLDPNYTQIEGNIAFGEWVYGTEGKRERRGSLKFKTIEIFASKPSALRLWVEDKQRDTYREVVSDYVLGRKPMVYGKSEKMRTGIKSDYGRGFRIDTVSFEGIITRRASSK